MGNIKVGDDTQVRFGAGSGSGQPGDMNLEFVSADSVLAVTDAAGNVLESVATDGTKTLTGLAGTGGIVRADSDGVLSTGAVEASELPAHTHTAADQGGDYPWADITGFGASGAATTVSRDDHVQAVDKGGTGATSAAAGLTALGGVAANTAITPGTGTKITADAKGLVTAVANMAASDIPAHTHTAADQGGDYPWADITGFAGSGTATTVPHSDHNHDVTYAPIAHNHDSDYADIDHNHDADYASIVHNHDADYADIVHNHDSDYSAIDHVQALDKGGTGAVTAEGARDAIELGATDSPTFAAVTATGTVEAGAFKAPAAAAGYVAHDASGNFIFSQSGVAAGSLPQGLETTDSPEFVGMTLSGLSTAGFVKNNSSGVLSTAAIAAADLPAHTHDAANQGGDLALGTMATQAANNVAITGGSVTGTVYAPRTIEVGVTGSAVLDEVGLEDGVLYRCTVTGTPATWAAVSGAAADEKVKYNADDAAAGYLADKIVAGDNITLAEGTGGNENKLVISASGGGAELPQALDTTDSPTFARVIETGNYFGISSAGLLARFPMRINNIAENRVNASHALTWAGYSSIVDNVGPYADCVLFGSTGTYAYNSSSGIAQAYKQASFSKAFWLRLPSGTSQKVDYTFGNDIVGGSNYLVFEVQATSLQSRLYLRGGGGLKTLNGPVMTAQQWHHVAFTRTYNSATSTVFKLYVDGVEYVGPEWTDVDDLAGSDPKVYIGGPTTGFGLASCYVGEVTMWSRVLTADECLTLYRSRERCS